MSFKVTCTEIAPEVRPFPNISDFVEDFRAVATKINNRILYDPAARLEKVYTISKDIERGFIPDDIKEPDANDNSDDIDFLADAIKEIRPSGGSIQSDIDILYLRTGFTWNVKSLACDLGYLRIYYDDSNFSCVTDTILDKISKLYNNDFRVWEVLFSFDDGLSEIRREVTFSNTEKETMQELKSLLALTNLTPINFKFFNGYVKKASYTSYTC